MKKLKHQAGFGLLELMLSMVIVALLLIMATRYYQSARDNSRINEAVSLVNALDNAANNIAIGSGSFTGITMASLTPYLPDNTTLDPWGGTMTATVSGTPAGTMLTIVMPGAQSADTCAKLNNALGTNGAAKAGYYDVYKCTAGTGFSVSINMQSSSGS